MRKKHDHNSIIGKLIYDDLIKYPEKIDVIFEWLQENDEATIKDVIQHFTKIIPDYKKLANDL